MSAQAGVFYFDSRPIDCDVVASIGRRLDAFGPDRAGQRAMPGLVMVHRALHVTPQDKLERQPFVSTCGHVLTWDGRLDNREDLLLQLQHVLSDETTDCALAMAAYEKWGPDGFPRLIGDWSLVIWDAAQQALVMASDYMGIRPLHYYVRPDSISWSTTLELLIDMHHLHDDLDQRFIVGYLCNAIAPGLTPYKGLLQVPAAHSITFTRSAAPQLRRFWQLSSREIRYQNPADYEAHLRSVFFDAVRTRLRSTMPVWAQLSGGLDSTCVVCAADVIVKQGLAAAPQLMTVGYVTDGSPETDERRFMVCVDQQTGLSTQYLQMDNSLDDPLHERVWTSPMQPFATLYRTYRLMNASGARVLLTGAAGDSVMGNFLDYHYDVAQTIRTKSPLVAVALARLRARAARRPIIDVLHDACWELAPSKLWMSRALSREFSYKGLIPPFTDAKLADLFLVKPEYIPLVKEEWSRDLAAVLSFNDISRRPTVRYLGHVSDRRDAQSPSDIPLASMSHPYLHRPLVYFMLGAPIEIIAPPGEARALMRRAFAPFVPARIISRVSKGYASPYIVRSARATLARWLDAPEGVRIGALDCVDRGRFFRYLESLRDCTSTTPDFFATLFRLERWLESRDEHLGRIANRPVSEGKEVKQQ